MTDTNGAPAHNTNTSGKNIILCSDGTGNRGGKTQGTNVWRIYNNVDLKSHLRKSNGPVQISYYADGVGTADFKPVKIIGGAFGWGLTRNIKDLYYFLINNYKAGDNIYLFGFSRGAFTVRSLAGLISTCGIPNKTLKNLNTDREMRRAVNTAFRVYRETQKKGKRIGVGLLLSRLTHRIFNKWESIPTPKKFREQNKMQDVKIHFIGVWDTVSAVGMPFDGMRKVLDFFFNIEFHDHTIGKKINNAFHALSIDDERQTFHPILWDETQHNDLQENGSNKKLEQVWFAGTHSNVGGGYPKQGMAHVSLHWMMNHAVNKDLKFSPGKLQEVRNAADATDRMYDSREGAGTYYRYYPRDISTFCSGKGINKPKIHLSVFERINTHVQDYAPGHIPADIEIIDTEDFDDKGKPLHMPASKLSNFQDILKKHREENTECFSYTKSLENGRRALYYVFLGFNLFVLMKIFGLRFDLIDLANLVGLKDTVVSLTGKSSFIIAIEALNVSGDVRGIDLLAAISNLAPWTLLSHIKTLMQNFYINENMYFWLFVLGPTVMFIIRSYLKRRMSLNLTQYWWQSKTELPK